MRSAVVVLVVHAALLGVPAAVAGQATEAERTALARSLFAEGVELATAERYEEAAERFRRVRELQPTPGVAYNLAAALERTGELVEASELLRGVLSSEEASEPLRVQAQELLATVEERVAHLTVRVDGPAEGARLTLDDAPLAPAAIGVEMPMDPGAHVVAAQRDDEVVATERVELEEGASAEVTLELPALELEPEETGAGAGGPIVVEPAPVEPSDGGGVLSSPWFWMGAAVVVAAGVVGGLYLAGVFDAPDAVEGNAMPGVITWD